MRTIHLACAALLSLAACTPTPPPAVAGVGEAGLRARSAIDRPRPRLRGDAIPTFPTVPHLVYYGGPIIEDVQLYAIYWGAGVSSDAQKTLPMFLDAMARSSDYFGMLGEYN